MFGQSGLIAIGSWAFYEGVANVNQEIFSFTMEESMREDVVIVFIFVLQFANGFIPKKLQAESQKPTSEICNSKSNLYDVIYVEFYNIPEEV
jgi:hypothetical protein